MTPNQRWAKRLIRCLADKPEGVWLHVEGCTDTVTAVDLDAGRALAWKVRAVDAVSDGPWNECLGLAESEGFVKAGGK